MEDNGAEGFPLFVYDHPIGCGNGVSASEPKERR
jgi:hypothetical protein